MRASGSRACTRQAARRQRTLLVAMQAQWLPTRADVLAVPEAGRSASPWQRAPRAMRSSNEVVNRVARCKGGIEVDQQIEPEPPRRPFRFDAHHAHRVIDP
jgi:hypothetical protein